MLVGWGIWFRRITAAHRAVAVGRWPTIAKRGEPHGCPPTFMKKII